MLDAFPNEDRVNSSNMRQFATAVAGLLHISDFQRRRITHMMRHYRDMRRRYPHACPLMHVTQTPIDCTCDCMVALVSVGCLMHDTILPKV